MPSKSKLNGDVVNLTACVVLASQRRLADACGFGAAREPHTTIAYAMYSDPDVEALVVQPARAKPLIAREALAVRPFCDLRLLAATAADRGVD
jgi:hypothetical protein